MDTQADRSAGTETAWPSSEGDRWPGIVAEPTDTGWRGRPIANDAHPEALGPVLCDAVRGHFHHDITELRRQVLHKHHGWHRIGGDFTQPAGYVPRAHQPPVTNEAEWTRFRSRNQCLCHDQRLTADTWIDDTATGHPAHYAYVLGDQALAVQIYGRPEHGPPTARPRGGRSRPWTGRNPGTPTSGKRSPTTNQPTRNRRSRAALGALCTTMTTTSDPTPPPAHDATTQAGSTVHRPLRPTSRNERQQPAAHGKKKHPADHLPRPTSRYGDAPGQPQTALDFSFEVVIIGGPEGQALHARQLRAIHEVLEWLHHHPHPPATRR